jgi:hypothetical protein
MVLIGIIGLIIIANALMVLLVLKVSGIRRKPSARNASRMAGPGSARIAGR